MIYTLKDGTEIETTMSDGYSGPGVEGGLRTAMNVAWYRADNGEWIRSVHRTMHKLADWIECCENLQDFLEGEK